jgi:group I intron endonuclease
MRCASPAKRHYVYTITNLIDGKRYVGLTIDPRRRWREHRRTDNRKSGSRLIRDAIERNGEAIFAFTILVCTNYEYGCKLEQDCIRHFNTLYPNGYNLETGGRAGHQHVDESITKMSVAHKTLLKQRPELYGRLTEGHRAYFANPANKGRHGCKGEASGRHKLTDDQVRYIRTSKCTDKQLAADLGVRRNTINRIRNNKTWTHVL